ncbi:MAG: DUF1351 domain-containing protein, partial [Paludibacter sp.]
MSEEKQIVVRQIPVIEHDLVTVGRSVTERIKALNLEAQVVTEDTVQTLKKLRAELNKESKEWDEQIKAVDEIASKPVKDFKEIAKVEVKDKYKDADEILKNKINEFELKLKTEKRTNLQLYFVEVCAVEKIDWLTFERLGIEVNLSTSEKKYKEQILEFITKVVDDMKLINSETFAAEMLVEYKRTLNASNAITSVRERKEQERLEQERIKMAETNRRKSQLAALSFVYHDLTRTMNWVQDENVLVTMQDIENASKERWNEIFVKAEAEVAERKRPTLGELVKAA